MAKHSPTPWRVSHGYIVLDADGVSIAHAVRCPDAAYIVEAVNGVDATLKLQRTLLGWSMERDRIRDLVRRLAEYIHHSCYDCGGPWEIDIKCSCRSDNYHGNADDLIREAREVLVEGEP
jgi:hypothetical protein